VSALGPGSSLPRSHGVDDDVDGCRAGTGHALEILEHPSLDVSSELGKPSSPVDVQVELDRDCPILAADPNAPMPVQLTRDEAANAVDLTGGIRGIACENLARDAGLTLQLMTIVGA